MLLGWFFSFQNGAAMWCSSRNKETAALFALKDAQKWRKSFSEKVSLASDYERETGCGVHQQRRGRLSFGAGRWG
jgi:hypothetical protein